MDLLGNAETFFYNSETLKGWDACRAYVSDNAKFIA